MTAVASVRQVDRVPPEKSRLWWCGWRKRTEIGAIVASRGRCSIWATNLMQGLQAELFASRQRPLEFLARMGIVLAVHESLAYASSLITTKGTMNSMTGWAL